jgi:undecaprenyl pyrophosphate synthase
MYGNTKTTSESARRLRVVGPSAGVGADGRARAAREPVVRAASLKVAITQLHDLTRANANRSSQEALAANLVLLRAQGVDDEVLDLVVEMVLAQNVDEEMVAALNYLATGFLLALLTLQQESTRRASAA